MRATAPGRPITHNGPRPVAARPVAVDPSSISGVHTDPEISLAQIMDGFEASKVTSQSDVSHVTARGNGGIPAEEVIAPAPPPKPGKALSRGALGVAVRRLQKTLVRLGHLSADAFASGPGVYGPRTEQAVRAFQLQVGLKPTGQVDALTELALQQSRRT